MVEELFGAEHDGTTRANRAATEAERKMAELVLGFDLDADLAPSGDPQTRALARCRQRVLKQLYACKDETLKAFNVCKKEGLRTGAAFDAASLAAQCLGAPSQPEACAEVDAL
jgi:hypothetical protein